MEVLDESKFFWSPLFVFSLILGWNMASIRLSGAQSQRTTLQVVGMHHGRKINDTKTVPCKNTACLTIAIFMDIQPKMSKFLPKNHPKFQLTVLRLGAALAPSGYEFMFWWPVQGVTFATFPVIFACGFIKLLPLSRKLKGQVVTSLVPVEKRVKLAQQKDKINKYKYQIHIYLNSTSSWNDK